MNKEKLLACPVCNQTDFLRASVRQDVDVTVNENGDIDNGCDFSDPDLDESGELFCSQCASHLQLTWTEQKKHHIVLDE